MGARIRDADGDIWEQQSDGDWSYCDPLTSGQAQVSWLPSRAVIDFLFGPISEVTE